MFGGVLLLTLCLVPSISNGAIVLKTTTSNRAWVDYKSYFNKEYDGVTETLRKEAFMESLKYVIVRNLAHELADESYQAGLNAVSDFTHDEIRCHRNEMDDAVETLTGGIYEGESESDKEVDYDDTLIEGEDESESDDTLCMCGKMACTDDLNWVEKGRVLPVGKQGCGDCYAWAATYALSSAAAIKSNSAPIDLSVQESKDCSYGFHLNRGCEGGCANRVYSGLVKQVKGKIVKTEEYNPYNTNEGKLKCNHIVVNGASHTVIVKKSGMHNGTLVTGRNKDCILRQQLSKGPVAAQMCVSAEVQHWNNKNPGDIYSNMNCTKDCQAEMLRNNEEVQTANHDVMIVGYTKNAWLVQNSWGREWGYNGRAKFARGKPGSKRICNLATEIYWPIL